MFLRLSAFFVLCFATAMPVMGRAETEEYDIGKQAWGTLRYYTKINEKLTGKFQASTRWDKRASGAFHHHMQLGLQYHKFYLWVPAAHYRLVVKKVRGSDGSIYWRSEHQPLLDVSRTWELDPWELALRHRFQYKSINNEWIYRIRGEIILPEWTCSTYRWHPFVSEELFWKVSGRFNENRSIFGVQFRVGRQHAARVGFMIRRKKESPLEYALRIDWLRWAEPPN